MDKNFDEFFDELNDMANFKNFGKKVETEEEEITIDGELSCNNCLEKTRCKQQQEAKEQRIDAILSYIANEDNEKYIAELKNEIPAITRCDVVLEKQLKRLEQENAELKEKNKALEETLQTIEQLKDEDSLRIAQLVTENARLKNERTADLVKQIDELKAENDELKHSNENLRLALKTYEMPEVVKVLTDWRTGELDLRINKYKHTLQEIKEIIEKGQWDFAGVIEKQILQVITKAEEE